MILHCCIYIIFSIIITVHTARLQCNIDILRQNLCYFIQQERNPGSHPGARFKENHSIDSESEEEEEQKKTLKKQEYEKLTEEDVEGISILCKYFICSGFFCYKSESWFPLVVTTKKFDLWQKKSLFWLLQVILFCGEASWYIIVTRKVGITSSFMLVNSEFVKHQLFLRGSCFLYFICK